MIDKIMKIYNKYKSQILYLLFGGLSTLLNIITFFILNSIVRLEYQIANVIAWVIVVIFAYVTNKIWVFESKTNSKKELAKETASFFIARLITLGMEFVLLYIFIEKLLILEIIAKIIINVIVIIANYFFSKLFIFNNQKKNFDFIKTIKIGIPIIIMILITSITIYRYDVSQKGYNELYYPYDINHELNDNDVEEQPIKLLSSQKISIDFEIKYDNAKYIDIYFVKNNEFDSERETGYTVKIVDCNNNIILENEINSKYIYNSKYKMNIESLSKGNYTLEFVSNGDNAKYLPCYNIDDESISFSIDDKQVNGYLKSKILYRKNRNYIILSVVSIIIFACLYAVCCIVLKNKNIKIENSFLLLSIPIYLLYFMFIPPNSGHDETNHWIRVFEITEGGLKSDIRDFKTGYDLPAGVSLRLPWMEEIKYSMLLHNDYSLDYSNKEFHSDETVSVYSPVQYLPQVIGVYIAKHITNNAFILYYVGRLFNIIACISILYLAIKKIPYAKKVLFILTFIPIAIEGFTTMSGDGILIAVSYYFTAYILNLIDKRKKMQTKDYIVLTLLGLFIASSKIVYIPLVFLLLLIPNSCFKSKKDKIIKLTIMILTFVFVNLMWLKIASPYLQVYTMGKSDYVIKYIFSNPFRYIQVFINSIEVSGVDLILQLFGKNILWNEVIVNNTLVPILLIIVTILTVKNEKIPKYNLFSKIVLLLIFLSIIALIFTSLYVQWTTYGSPSVIGVQGRYFLPILLSALIAVIALLKNKNKIDNRILKSVIIYTCAFVNYITILKVIAYFL